MICGYNLTCAHYTYVGFLLLGITRGEFQFVFSSPESVLKPYWRNVFLTPTWQARLHLIAVDEAHCISEWGDDFRKDYRQLSELRSILKALIMALTATTTGNVKEDIMKYLQLSEDDTDIVFRSCDRPNIYIIQLSEDDTDIVFRSYDRPNIYIQVVKNQSTDYEVSLD